MNFHESAWIVMNFYEHNGFHYTHKPLKNMQVNKQKRALKIQLHKTNNYKENI